MTLSFIDASTLRLLRLCTADNKGICLYIFCKGLASPDHEIRNSVERLVKMGLVHKQPKDQYHNNVYIKAVKG